MSESRARTQAELSDLNEGEIPPQNKKATSNFVLKLRFFIDTIQIIVILDTDRTRLLI